MITLQADELKKAITIDTSLEEMSGQNIIRMIHETKEICDKLRSPEVKIEQATFNSGNGISLLFKRTGSREISIHDPINNLYLKTNPKDVEVFLFRASAALSGSERTPFVDLVCTDMINNMPTFQVRLTYTEDQTLDSMQLIQCGDILQDDYIDSITFATLLLTLTNFIL